MALVRFGFVYPALARWANVFRTSGAKTGALETRERAKAFFVCTRVSRRSVETFGAQTSLLKAPDRRRLAASPT